MGVCLSIFWLMSFHAGAAAPTDSGSSMHLFGFTWLPKSTSSISTLHLENLRWQESKKVQCLILDAYIALCRLHQWATALQCWEHDVQYIFIILQRGDAMQLRCTVSNEGSWHFMMFDVAKDGAECKDQNCFIELLHRTRHWVPLAGAAGCWEKALKHHLRVWNIVWYYWEIM